MKSSLDYIRNRYHVPAKRGGKVRYRGKSGTIVGAHRGYLRIRLDGEKSIGNYHPTYELEYLDCNNDTCGCDETAHYRCEL